MKRAAFTLIEVMVVLSILAIIAILGYNFFGSTMKEANATAQAIEVHRQIGAMSRAYDEYTRKTGKTLSLEVAADQDALRTFMVGEGGGREIPNPDDKWLNPDIACGTIQNPTKNWWPMNKFDFVTPGGAEQYVYLYCISTPVCEKINEIAGIDAMNIALAFAKDYGGILCTSDNAAGMENVVIGVLDKEP